MPRQIPIPNDATPITPGRAVQVTPGAGPAVLVFDLPPRDNPWSLGLQKGSNVTFAYTATAPMRLGIYGPDPAHIGAAGRMCAPKAQLPEEPVSRCQGNYAPGRYYLVMRSNTDGPPGSPFTLTITAGPWQAISRQAPIPEEPA